MKPTTAISRRGITLVECLVFIAIWAGVCGSTLWALRESALTRGQARQAAVPAVIAQGELEQARALPADKLKAGSTDRTDAAWPAGTSCTVTLAPHSPSTWLINVEAARTTARGLKPVRLTTYRRGAS
jgi:hypothetical protein